MKKHRLISLTAVLAAALPLLGAGLAARAQQAPNKGLTRPPIGGPLDVTKQINPFVEQVEKYPGLTSLEVTNKKVTIPAGETRPIGIKVLGGGLDFVLPNSTGDGWDHFPPEITFTSSNNAVAVAPDGMITAVGTGMAEITVTATAREKRFKINGRLGIYLAGSLSQSITVTVTPALPGGGRELTQWTPAPTRIFDLTDVDGAYTDRSGGVECADELRCTAGMGQDADSSAFFDLLHIQFGIAAGQGARMIYSTSDGGSTWPGRGRYRHISEEEAWGIRSYTGNRSCWSRDVCVAVTRDGIFITKYGLRGTRNGWVTPPGADGAMHGVSCANASLCVAVGPGGKIQASTDGGSRWTTRASGTSASLTNVSCRRESWCVAVGANGTILRSANGIDWTASASGTTNALAAVACGSPRSCVAVGSGGTLLTSGDRGVTWTAHNTGTTQDLTDVSCPRQSFCLVVGTRGTVLRGSP
jgi:photosystem II stability/assembly factor-like uncharacterized protein